MAHKISVEVLSCMPFIRPSTHAFFMKSIRLRPKPDVLASEDFFFASIASKLLRFLDLALFLLLAFVESGAFAIWRDFVGDGLVTPGPKVGVWGSDPVLFLDINMGIGKRVILLQGSHL
jgi:hypothetical protein